MNWKQYTERRYWKEIMFPPGESPQKKAMALSLGVFIGVLPFWGFQTILAITLSSLFRLNRPLAVLGSGISITPLLPFIVFSSLSLGNHLIDNPAELRPISELGLQDAKEAVLSYLLGSVPSSILWSASFFLIFLAIFSLVQTVKARVKQ